MTVGTATVPAIVNANGTWTIDNNGTATTHVFDLDATLFNYTDDNGHEMLALSFDEDTDEASLRYNQPNGTDFILSWGGTAFTGAGFTLTPPQGFAFLGAYDQAVDLHFHWASGHEHKGASVVGGRSGSMGLSRQHPGDQQLCHRV